MEGRFLIDDGLSTVSAFVEANSQWEQEYVALHDLEMSAMLGGPGPSVSAGPGSANLAMNASSDSARSLAEDMEHVHFVDEKCGANSAAPHMRMATRS